MSDADSRRTRAVRERRNLFILVFCGIVLWLIYTLIVSLSARFSYQTPGVTRPIIEVFSLFAAAFAIYLIALRVAIQAGQHRQLLPVIGLFAFSMRLLLLFSEPIQEVDIYRYMWDGQAMIHGVSPFRYSPLQVLESSKDLTLPSDLSKLVTAKNSSPAIETILNRVHFTELSTVYPPVSQTIFALAALTTPSHSSLSTHLIVMKAWIVLFDMATIGVIILILRFTAKPVGWSVVYAWCPLVLKEFANSGHLDSIAVCLTTLAVYMMLRAFYSSVDQMSAIKNSKQTSLLWGAAAPMFLALAVGAKLYPIILSPLLILVSVQKLGWSRATMVAFVFLLVLAGVCWPMVSQSVSESRLAAKADRRPLDSQSSMPPMPTTKESIEIIDGSAQQAHGEGLTTFLSRWKMNDFLFLLVSENLTPLTKVPASQRPWFIFTSENWRRSIVTQLAALTSLSQEQVPFALARTFTAIVFLILASYFCWRAIQANKVTHFLEGIFLTLAWFWLLLPTQNPWYWTWAVPFLPFTRNRAWLALSGLTLMYYLRFWLGYHWPDPSMTFTTYSGERFFDFVVTWLEFGPWFVWLAMGWAMKRWWFHK